MSEIEIMKNTKSFAIIGASAKEDSYGFRLVKNLKDWGYNVYPINPKYDTIYGLKTFKSFDEIKDKIDNLVFAMSPDNNKKVLQTITITNSHVWFPPECWDEELLKIADLKKIKYLIDTCPIGTYLKIANYNKKEKL